jgi:hypothetical protein
MNPWPKNICLHFLSYLWIQPNSFLGALFFILLKLTKHYPIYHVSYGCVDVVVPKSTRLANYLRNKGWGAVTLGNFIFYWGLDQYAYPETQLHERRHIHQQTYLGPLFYPAYFLLLLLGYLKHKNITQAYKTNPLELDAQKYADKYTQTPYIELS